MKKILLTLCILISCKGNKVSNQKNIVESYKIAKNSYRIVKIDSVEDVYVFYAKKNDSIFKIASKNEKNEDCKITIKNNETYELELKSIFPPNFYQKRDIAGFEFTETAMIKLGTNNSIWDLFVSKNINGLCYEE